MSDSRKGANLFVNETPEDIRSYTIPRFLAKAAEIHNAKDPDDPTDTTNVSNMVEFVLSGRQYEQTEQASLNVLANAITNRDLPNLVQEHDFDSLIGIAHSLNVTGILSVYPVPRFEDTLRSEVHIQYTIEHVRDGITTTVEAPLHLIPNIGFGKLAQRHLVRILLPALYDPMWETGKDVVPPSREILASIYDNVTRPVWLATFRSGVGHIPVSYDDEMYRISNVNSKGVSHSFGTQDIPSFSIPQFGQRFLARLRSHSFGKGAFFLHTVRGTRAASAHDGFDEDDRNEALLEWMSWVRTHPNEDIGDRWFVDVGVELRIPGHCLQWRKDGHIHIVKHFLDNVTNPTISRMLRPHSKRYKVDSSATLTQLAGFRLSTTPRTQGVWQVKYFNCYTTDKAVTYHAANGRYAKFTTARELFDWSKSNGPANLRSMYSSLSHARDAFDGHARLELRIPLRYVRTINGKMRIPDELVKQSIVVFKRRDWWSFKLVRLQSLLNIIEWISQGGAVGRGHPASLTLLAACAWLVNAQNNRPAEGQAETNLRWACLPHRRIESAESGEEDDPDEEEDSEPSQEFGVFFFRALSLPPWTSCPRIWLGRELNDRSFQFFFGASRDELFMTLGGGFQKLRAKPPNHHTNKAVRTQTVRAPAAAREDPEFNLEELGHSLPAPEIEHGPDVDASAWSMPGHEDGLDRQLSGIWHQFLSDIMQKAPTTRNGSGYYIGTKPSPDFPAINIFKNVTLSASWRACQVKEAGEEDWAKAFGNIFPSNLKGMMGFKQGYPNCTYYAKWTALMGRASTDTVGAMMIALKTQFDTLVWLPNATACRIWDNKVRRSFVPFGEVEPKGGPQLILNPRYAVDQLKWEERAQVVAMDVDGDDDGGI